MPENDSHNHPSFSLQNRLCRVFWNLVYTLFFRYSPRPMFAWRSMLLSLFGAKVGQGVHVYPKAVIWAPWNLELGDECAVADEATLYSQALIRIGKKAVISQGSYLCAGTHDYTVPGFPLIAKPIVIGNYSWIAAQVFIHPGVRIGEGAVIGARSVVHTDQPDWTICAGFPCQAIKPRVSAEEIEKFQS